MANAARSRKNSPNPATSANEIGLDDHVYQEPTTAAWREAWDLTEHIILAFNDTVMSLDAKLLIVTLTNGDQVNPDPQVRAKFMDRLAVKDLTYPDRRIANFCQTHGIPCLTLCDPLLDYAENNHVYLHGFPNAVLGRGHWNETGHRVAAELISERLVQLISASTQLQKVNFKSAPGNTEDAGSDPADDPGAT